MSYDQVTLANLQTLLAQRWEQTPFWSAADATQHFNISLRTWNYLTGYFKSRDTKATTANTIYYDMPTTTLLMYRISAYYNLVPMQITNLDSINNGRPNWRTETTASGGDVPNTPRAFIPLGLNKFAIWPAHAAGGATITIDGVRAAPILANAGDFIQLGEEELNLCIGMTFHTASFKIGGPVWQGTFKFYRDFIKAAGERNALLKASSFYRNLQGLDTEQNFKPLKVQTDALDNIVKSVGSKG